MTPSPIRINAQRISPAIAAAAAIFSCITSITYEYDQTFWICVVNSASGGAIAGMHASIVNKTTSRATCSTSTDANGWGCLRLHEQSRALPIDTNAYLVRLIDRDSLANGGFFDTLEARLDFSADTLVFALRLLAPAP